MKLTFFKVLKRCLMPHATVHADSCDSPVLFLCVVGTPCHAHVPKKYLRSIDGASEIEYVCMCMNMALRGTVGIQPLHVVDQVEHGMLSYFDISR